MGLYLLNVSVDISDPNPQFVPEDLSINDQESIVEIILEKVLGYENAIEEHDDHDTEDQNEKKTVKVDLLTQLHTPQGESNHLNSKKSAVIFAFDDFLVNGFYEIDSPPPQV